MRAFIKKLTYIRKDQRGFSLIELLAAMAISSIIVVGLVMTIFQLYNGHAQTSGEMNVIRQVQQAGYYISRDTQMASEVDPVDDPGTAEVEVVTLIWYWFEYHGEWEPPRPADRDGAGNKVIYTLEDSKLYRNYYFAPEDDNSLSPFYGEVNEDDYVLESRTFIAEYISSIFVEFDFDDAIYKLTVTASVEGIAGEQEETRTYEAKPRPNVF